MRVSTTGLACLAAAVSVSCGSADHGASPVSPAATPSPPPAVLVTPPPANSVIQLTTAELIDLAHEHRIKSATIYNNGVSGMELSDVSSGQQFSSPRPATPAAVTSLTRTLTEAGATVNTKPGPAPSP
ncbi:MAG: hypothetical protein ABR541_01225 [Candidatus Dormibacteria bacterium]